MRRYDLSRMPVIGWLLRSRLPQLCVTALALAGFLIAIVAGVAGTPVGSRNFGIIAVWLVWWSALMLVAVPLLGRAWCSICPIPVPGEWLQRGAVLGPHGRGIGLNRRWPKIFRNMWLQSGAFVLVALFSTVILTSPFVSGLVLGGLLIIATITGLVFERRSFCRYLCPVGGFVGLYSQVAPIEVRVKNAKTCAACIGKSCYKGSADGYGCPWLVYPRALAKNIHCGLCLECLRTCENSNVAVNLRPFGTDLLEPRGKKLDEAYKTLIMLGSAMIYAAVLLGPWGFLKTAAYSVGSMGWVLYALGFLVIVVVLLPGLFLLTVRVAGFLPGASVPTRTAFAAYGYALIPLSLAAWIAFSLAFVLANSSYIWAVLSDPMGWGWNLTGSAGASWTPYLTGVTPVLVVAVLLGGLAWSIVLAHRTAQPKGNNVGVSLQALPVTGFFLVVTVSFLRLLVG